MEVISSAQQKWVPYPGQRAVTTNYKTIFKGKPKAKDNFELSIIRIGAGGSFSPRHRHNFEQFRLPLNADFNQSPKHDIPKGHLGYIPEGTPYGPQDLKPGLEFLLLQCAGPSGAGYMSHEELMQGTNALKAAGEFSGGIFRRAEIGGQADRLNQDAYEAVWEQVNGRRIEYASPRYLEPVTIDPNAFEWTAVEGASGVKQKHFGTFNERGSSAWHVHLSPGSTYACTASQGRKLAIVLDGAISHEGKTYQAWSAFNIGSGETAFLAASAGVEALLLVLQMPKFTS